MKKYIILIVVSLLMVTSQGSANALPAKKFANCTALNKVYPHGVAKKGYSKTASGLTGKPKVSNSLYSQNSGSDRDKDGVACEK
jgi:hypothetical protein